MLIELHGLVRARHHGPILIKGSHAMLCNRSVRNRPAGRARLPLSLVTAVLCAAALAPAASAAEQVIEGVGFAKPESVLHDTVHDLYLVANINGGPTEKDGNGFISRLHPDGSIAALKWIDGADDAVALDAPKGMVIHEDALFVADIDTVRAFDLESGRPLGNLEIPGAIFLNDITVAADGTLYVTDSGDSHDPGAIYRVTGDGKVSRIAHGPELKNPNGIAFDDAGRLVFVTMGGRDVVTMTTEGGLLARRHLDVGRLDGLMVQEGAVLVSSWEGEAILRLPETGPTERVLDHVGSPAAFDLDRRRMRLLVPLLSEDRVLLHDLH